jgi:hypothetical protein
VLKADSLDADMSRLRFQLSRGKSIEC